MSRSTQQQHKDAAAAATTAWSSESVYTKLAATPTAPNMSGHGHATPVKNAASLPFAIAVESPVFGQHPQALAPAASTAPLGGAHGGAYGAAPATPTSRPTTTTCRSKALCWISRLPLLLLFHACNFALGLAAFVLVVTLLPLSVGLLPLCCIGVVVFRITAWTTEWLAVLDVFLANLVRGSDDTKLRVHPRMGAPRFDASSAGDASEDKSMFAKLLFVSQRNLGAMLYFATLKFAVGVLSIVAAACATTGPVHAIVLPVYSDYELCGFTYDDHPVAYVFTAIGITLVGLLLLPAVASLSRQLTKHVCAADDSDTRVPVAAAPGMLV